MAKSDDVVKQGVRQIQDLLKQVKDSDEQDLAAIAKSFDVIARTADSISDRFLEADRSLSGSKNKEQGQSQGNGNGNSEQTEQAEQSE